MDTIHFKTKREDNSDRLLRQHKILFDKSRNVRVNHEQMNSHQTPMDGIKLTNQRALGLRSKLWQSWTHGIGLRCADCSKSANQLGLEHHLKST